MFFQPCNNENYINLKIIKLGQMVINKINKYKQPKKLEYFPSIAKIGNINLPRKYRIKTILLIISYTKEKGWLSHPIG